MINFVCTTIYCPVLFLDANLPVVVYMRLAQHIVIGWKSLEKTLVVPYYRLDSVERENNMALWNSLRRIRKAHGLSMAQCAAKLGIGVSHQSTIEVYPASKRIPSVDYLRRFAAAFAETEAERRDLTERLLLELARIQQPEEIVEKYLTGTPARMRAATPMPEVFLRRLARDMAGRGDAYRQAGLTGNDLRLVLAGDAVLTRDQVVAVAQAYEQPTDEYLLAAEYLPEELYPLTDLPAEQAKALLNALSKEVQTRLPRHLKRHPGRPPLEAGNEDSSESTKDQPSHG